MKKYIAIIALALMAGVAQAAVIDIDAGELGTIAIATGAADYAKQVIDAFAGEVFEVDGVTPRTRTGEEYKAALIVYLNERGFNSFLNAVQQAYNAEFPPLAQASVGDHITLTAP